MPNKPKQNYTAEVGQSGRDLFQTPRYAVELLLPYIPKNVDLIWECAAGDGRLASVLNQNDYATFSSDINGHGRNINFLESIISLGPREAIITNPPYSLKMHFFAKCLMYKKPFALLIPADYCLWTINAITEYGCKKLVPTRRIDYITPNMLENVNLKLGTSFPNLDAIPNKILKRFTSGQFHSMWLCKDFDLPEQETFVELTNDMKERIL